MEQSSETQKAHVDFAATLTTPAGDVWHVTENVENEFDWEDDDI